VPFINKIYYSILEAILENKKTLNQTLLSLLDIYAIRGENFKSIFIEMIVRKALKSIATYCDDKETIIKDIYPILSYVNNIEIDLENQQIIADYKKIRNKFYSEDKNNLTDILDIESDLYLRLLEYYQ